MVTAARHPIPLAPRPSPRLLAEAAPPEGGRRPPSGEYLDGEPVTDLMALPLVHGSAARELAAGAVIDRRYVLRREIARGGGGHVYEAEHVVSGRRVALKLVPPGEPSWVEKRARLMREARALVTARHPNVVELLDAGTDERGIPYLAMELLEGRPLNGLIAARRVLDPSSVAAIGLDLSRALAQAHRQGIYHRDVKPGNVFITRGEDGEERVKLIDYGIAGMEEAISGEVRITSVGAVLGTPEYLAPERLLGRVRNTVAAEVYSLGVLLFECLTGGLPYEGNVAEITVKASRGPVPDASLRNPAAPPALAGLIAKAMAPEPTERFESLDEMGARLAELAGSGSARLPLLDRSRLARSSGDGALADVVAEAAEPGARRRFPRAPYVTPVRLVLGDGSFLDGRSEDISEGGMLAIVPSRCESTAPIRVRFALPVTGRVITAQARSRWVRVARTGAAAGLEFDSLSEEHRAAIRAYVVLMHGE